MKIKYYGFNKEFICEDEFNSDSKVVDNIYGFEIFDGEEKLYSCFQGQFINILDIISKRSKIIKENDIDIDSMKILTLTQQIKLERYAEKCFKENTTQWFVMNVNENNISFIEADALNSSYTYNSEANLFQIFNDIKQDCIGKKLGRK